MGVHLEGPYHYFDDLYAHSHRHTLADAPDSPTDMLQTKFPKRISESTRIENFVNIFLHNKSEILNLTRFCAKRTQQLVEHVDEGKVRKKKIFSEFFHFTENQVYRLFVEFPILLKICRISPQALIMIFNHFYYPF